MATLDVQSLTEEIKKRSQFVDAILAETSKVIVGQKILIERLLVALLCDGHVLLEGLPGLAKTLTIKTLADVIEADFKRISADSNPSAWFRCACRASLRAHY